MHCYVSEVSLPGFNNQYYSLQIPDLAFGNWALIQSKRGFSAAIMFVSPIKLKSFEFAVELITNKF